MSRTALTVLLGLTLAACAAAPDPITEVVVVREPEPAPVASIEPAPVVEELPMEEPVEELPMEEPEAVPPAPAKPEQTPDGRWRVAVAAERTAEEAAKWSPRLAALGYRSETESVELGGATWQRVVLPGYRALSEARTMIPILVQELSIPNAWVPARSVAAAPQAPVAPEAAAPPSEPPASADAGAPAS